MVIIYPWTIADAAYDLIIDNELVIVARPVKVKKIK